MNFSSSSFVIYRCEKRYMRRRLQESFHMSPSSGGLLCNGGFISSHLGSNQTAQIPTISVSVQTEPQYWTNVGLSNTSGLLVNGGLQQQQLQQAQVISTCRIIWLNLFHNSFCPPDRWMEMDQRVLWEDLLTPTIILLPCLTWVEVICRTTLQHCRPTLLDLVAMGYAKIMAQDITTR